jgi:hypothetical protein
MSLTSVLIPVFDVNGLISTVGTLVVVHVLVLPELDLTSAPEAAGFT